MVEIYETLKGVKIYFPCLHLFIGDIQAGRFLYFIITIDRVLV